MASLRARQSRPCLAVESKGGVDLVTEVDRLCEKEITQALHAEYPTHAFIGEESTFLSTGELSSSSAPFGLPGESAPTWIIDPIDGTTNFVHGHPFIAVAIGLSIHQDVVLGVIYLPVLNEMYRAWRGGGARCNDGPLLKVSGAQSIHDALLVNNIGSCREEEFLQLSFHRLYALMTAKLPGPLQGLRMSGSACVNLALVAGGRLDAYVEDGVGGVWDVAAGKILVEEAGGVVVGWEGEPWVLRMGRGRVIAGNAALVSDLVARMRDVDGRVWRRKRLRVALKVGMIALMGMGLLAMRRRREGATRRSG